MPRRIAVVLAGGGGTRLWPASTAARPKQLMDPLLGGTSLLSQTIDRVADLADETWVVTTEDQCAAVEAVGPGVDRIIAEPFGRNTAPAVGLAVRYAEAVDPDATLLALPADHHIADAAGFRRDLLAACLHAEADGAIATLGITPDRPATGFGYIERASDALPARPGDEGVAVYPASRFIEKPDRARAEALVASGRFLWNAGVFVMPRARIARELDRHCAQLWSALAPLVEAIKTDDRAAIRTTIAQAYRSVTPAPIDVAVMEKLDDIRVVPADVGWTDLGSWEAIYELAAKDEDGNAAVWAEAAPVVLDGRGNLVWAESAQVAVLGLRDVVVVQSGDRILVLPRAASQRVREIVETLRDREPAE